MSLLRRPNGCHECCRRRIRCDKAEPQCFKCQKKGLKCSGQGIRFRFSDGQSSRSRRKTPQASLLKAPQCLDASLQSRHSAMKSYDKSPPLPNFLVQELDDWVEVDDLEDSVRACLNPQPQTSIQILDPKARMLFKHFSDAIAPIMVVLDTEFNGYRDIILPMACGDGVVQRAVSVVSAFHLAATLPELQLPADVGQMNIISRLRRDASVLPSNELFNVSTWATILVLLVGETVTGGNDFIYLLEMLRCVTQNSVDKIGISASVRQFFIQQTRMFELFGFPLSQESKGIQTLKRNPDYYLDFMSYTLNPDSEVYKNIELMKNAIRTACEIYRRRAESSLPHNESIGLIEQLRLAVINIDHETEGSHALVWSYFIGAAESVLPSHRDFFTKRLRALFGRTKFRSIPGALYALEKIWAMQGFRRWTEVIVDENPILVM